MFYITNFTLNHGACSSVHLRQIFTVNKIDSRVATPHALAVTKLQVLRVQKWLLRGCERHDSTSRLLLHYVEETSLAKDVELPVTPCIIVCGPSYYAAVRFMLAVDRKIVNDDITSFISAVCLMFGSYYCSNIHYPTELASVLEFLQRCFFIINPEKGNKGGGNEKQKATPS